MIVAMKKLALVCVSSDRDHTLDVLAEQGVVHISRVALPEGHDLEKAQHNIDRIHRVLKELPAESHTPPSDFTPEETVEAMWGVILRRQLLCKELWDLNKEKERISPFGLFDPTQVTALAKKGVVVNLYTCHPKDKIEIQADAVRVNLRTHGNVQYFAVIRKGPIEINASSVNLPERSLDQINRSIQMVQEEIKEQNLLALGYDGDHLKVRVFLNHAKHHLQFLKAKMAMGQRGSVSYLRGYFPAEAEVEIRHAASKHGWAVLIQDPTAEENAPTMIRNSKWIRPIQILFDFIHIVPGYHEVDISALFLFFFSVFFAMIVGDAGYGAVFLTCTVVGRVLVPKAPREIWFLLLVMSLGTIAWGLMTGTVFGLERIPTSLQSLRVSWLTHQDHVIKLCFLIGAIHLSLAHGWNVIRYLNSTKAFAQVGWICMTWVMFFTACTMVVGMPFPDRLVWVFGSGVVLILTCTVPISRWRTEWFNYMLIPLNVINNFVDVVSYIRLFAVGMATCAMASSFNQMAGESTGGILHGIGIALLLFMGHVLNILLATMGVLVHGIRLNTLEFSSHLGQQWNGRKYVPFTRFSDRSS